ARTFPRPDRSANLTAITNDEAGSQAMKTGFIGTFVISWSQTEIDGLEFAPQDALHVGAAWSWRGDALRVDGPAGILRLDESDGQADLRRRAARNVRRLVGAALRPSGADAGAAAEPPHPMADSVFVATDGARAYT